MQKVQVIGIKNYQEIYKLFCVVNENMDMLTDGKAVGYWYSPEEALAAVNSNTFTTAEANKFVEEKYTEYGPVKYC